MNAYINSKHPHSTCWLELRYEASELPKLALIKDSLANAGWVPSDVPPVPSIDGVHELTFVSPGTGLFCSWTANETKWKVGSLRKVLRLYKLKADRHKLELADML